MSELDDIIFCILTLNFIRRLVSFFDLNFVENYFPYMPADRGQLWRYLTYMFVHGDLMHLVVNVINQLVLGIPMEYISSWWRLSAVYLSGVLSGALVDSVIKTNIGLIGASTGGYAILAASIFRMHNLMHWHEMNKKQKIKELINAIIFIFFFEIPVFTTSKEISHIGHVFGALGGFFAGLVFINDVEIKNCKLDMKIKVASGCSYGILVGVPICIHIFWTSHFI